MYPYVSGEKMEDGGALLCENNWRYLPRQLKKKIQNTQAKQPLKMNMASWAF